MRRGYGCVFLFFKTVENYLESNVKLDFLIQNLKSFSKGYFKPILDLKASRLFAIETFKSHKGN